MFSVSVLPRFLCDSGRVGWQGSFFTGIVGAPTGTVDHLHQQYCLLRSQDAIEIRPRGAHNWDLAPAGMNVWQPGDEQHASWRRGGRAQFLFIAPEQAERVLGEPMPRIVGTPYRPHEPRLTELIFDALAEDLAQGSPAGPLVGDGLIAGLIAHIAGSVRRPATLTAPARERVADFVDAHLARRMSLVELAAVAGISVRQFSRSFRAATGQSPHQYLLNRRVERAKALIASGRSLAEVALLCGFADQSQLTRVFAQRVGTTPARYRTSLRG